MAPTRRTKIVATVGPATSASRRLERLIRAGADCLRFNFSHGTVAGNLAAMRAARGAARRAGRPVALLADLGGPKIRTGPAPEGGVRLAAGSRVEIVAGATESSPRRIGVSYPRLAEEVAPGQRVLLADGRIELVVERAGRGRLTARVRTGGVLGARKGVNLPGAELSAPALTARDRRALRAAAKAGPEYVALSFVRSPKDLDACRRAMRRAGLGGAGLIAKIETVQALGCIEGILERCEGVMVARGDLGVEMRPEEIPAVQRELIERAALADRLCIVATEMFESMVTISRPTRAEVSDVAGAVREGADAVMLSAETSIGRHPVEAVRTMGRVLAAAERSLVAAGALATAACGQARGGMVDILALGARIVGRELGGAVLVAATETGRTALYLAKSRPASPILGMSPSPAALRRMALYWGVQPVPGRPYRRHAALLEAAERAAVRFAGARRGRYVVILSGTPLGAAGNANTLQIRRVGG